MWVVALEDGSVVEASLVGNEGIIGLAGLEASCCECYHVSRSLYERIVHATDAVN
jgi:hypothetical protein